MFFGGVMFLWVLILSLIVLVPFWKIFQKAGFGGALAILMLVPIANIIMIFFLGFAEWPSLRKPQPPPQ
jgi:hypothetical protein